MPNGRNAGRLYPIGSQEAQDLDRMAKLALERDHARASEQEATEAIEVMKSRWWAEDAANVHAKVTLDSPTGGPDGGEWWRVEVSDGFSTTSSGAASKVAAMETASALLEERLDKAIDRVTAGKLP